MRFGGFCLFFFFLMIRRPPRSTLFPTRRSSDLSPGATILPPSRVTISSTRARPSRSEEHTSELQSRSDLVCRLLLEKKKRPPRRGLLRRRRCGTGARKPPAPRRWPRRHPRPRDRCFFFLMRRRPPRSTLFPYTTLFRSTVDFGPPPKPQGVDFGPPPTHAQAVDFGPPPSKPRPITDIPVLGPRYVGPG